MIAIVTLSLAALLSVDCSKSGDTTATTAPPAPDSTGVAGYTLVWHDEFDGPAVDGTKWNYEVNGNGGGNNELQYYTARPENSSINNGALVIVAAKETYLGKSYTSARMTTAFKGDWKYGRVIVRAKLPYGQGLWPAIWMMPTDSFYGSWPASGEIDIMEVLGQAPDKVYGTIHFAASGAHAQSGGSFTLPSPYTFSGGFHTFTVDWDSTGIQWYADGVKYFTTPHGAPFDQRFFLILNVAVGGNWPGSPDAFTIFPQYMYVDYARVYKKN